MIIIIGGDTRSDWKCTKYCVLVVYLHRHNCFPDVQTYRTNKFRVQITVPCVLTPVNYKFQESQNDEGFHNLRKKPPFHKQRLLNKVLLVIWMLSCGEGGSLFGVKYVLSVSLSCKRPKGNNMRIKDSKTCGISLPKCVKFERAIKNDSKMHSV